MAADPVTKPLPAGYEVDGNCLDCGADTFDLGEYYHVHDYLWQIAVGDEHAGMVCLGCLETRLGRRLTGADFTDAPVNWSDHPFTRPRSSRMLNRLHR